MTFWPSTCIRQSDVKPKMSRKMCQNTPSYSSAFFFYFSVTNVEIQQTTELEMSVGGPWHRWWLWLTESLKTWSPLSSTQQLQHGSKAVSRQKSWSCSYLCAYIRQPDCPYCFNIWTVGWRFSSTEVIYIFLPHSHQSKPGCQRTVTLSCSSWR